MKKTILTVQGHPCGSGICPRRNLLTVKLYITIIIDDHGYQNANRRFPSTVRITKALNRNFTKLVVACLRDYDGYCRN